MLFFYFLPSDSLFNLLQSGLRPQYSTEITLVKVTIDCILRNPRVNSQSSLYLISK